MTVTELALSVLDLLLALGLALRLTRLITSDTITKWYFREPLSHWASAKESDHSWRLYTGLECPFCIGFWIGAAVLGSLALAGGPGEAADWWRWTAAIFALNYVAAHINARLDPNMDDD